MRSMYKDAKANVVLYAVFGIVLVVSLAAAIREQALVRDEQFLRSMIPHHSGAVLMCSKGQIRDDEINNLCANIILSQTQEIDQMKGILKRL